MSGILVRVQRAFGRFQQQPQQRPLIALPTVAATVIVTGFLAAVIGRLGAERVFQPFLEIAQRNPELIGVAPEDLPWILEELPKSLALMTCVTVAINTPLAILLTGWALIPVARRLGGQGALRPMLAVTAWATLAGALMLAVTGGVVMLIRDPAGLTLMDLAPLSLGFLVDRQGAPFIHALLSGVELNSLASLWLFCAGLSEVTRVSFRRWLAVMGGVWFAFVLVLAVFGAML